MATRTELFHRLGILKPIVEPVLKTSYEIEEEQIWREDLFSSPHGDHWHLSFHASSFPGDDPKACGRKALYTLMNIPSVKPIDRAGRAVMEVGKAIEESIVWRFHRSGLLLTPPPGEIQFGFEDKEHWLTGSPDAIIKDPRRNVPHPIEIKTKDAEVLEKMIQNKCSYDEEHRRQALTYIGFTAESFNKEGLESCKDGTLLYIGRNRPHVTKEYRFTYSPEFMKSGRIKLAEWKNNFEQETLPERPKDWKWTEKPCKWCPVKPVCKADYKEKITNLSQSNSIQHAKEIRGNYDYETTRNEVLERWK